MRALLAALLLPTLLLAALPSQAQTPRELYDFELIVPLNVIELDLPDKESVEVIVRDLSRDSTTFVPGAPNAAPVLPHEITVTAAPLDGRQPGWSVGTPSPIASSYAGNQHVVKVPITVLREADRSFLKVNVTMTATTEGGTFVRSGVIIAHTSGVLDIQVRAIGDLEPMAPRDIVTAQVEVENLGLMARAFGAEIVSNPCGLDVAPPPGTTLAKSEKRDISFDIQAPADKPWYYYQNCDLQVDFFAVDNTAARKSISYSVVVDGFYVDPGWVITIVAWAILIFLGLLVAKGIRDRRQELVHAKPQKPWLIPIERVYLDQLKKEDPRAWYVVRHFLMEDEYRSALAWWHSYRAADKGGLSKERLILKEEASYAAWKEQWDRRIAAPLAKAEKKEAALLRKLRKKAAKAHRQAAKKSQADNAKIEAADAKRNAREVASWEKQAAKAKKKGRPAPPRPAVQRSPLTDAPAVKQVTLEGHRYGRKAERIRKRAIRKQGNLEVRFENADARRQERMQRKIEKLAQKLDDPQFAREHGVT